MIWVYVQPILTVEKIAGISQERSAEVKSREHLPKNKVHAWRVIGISWSKVNDIHK